MNMTIFKKSAASKMTDCIKRETRVNGESLKDATEKCKKDTGSSKRFNFPARSASSRLNQCIKKNMNKGESLSASNKKCQDDTQKTISARSEKAKTNASTAEEKKKARAKAKKKADCINKAKTPAGIAACDGKKKI